MLYGILKRGRRVNRTVTPSGRRSANERNDPTVDAIGLTQVVRQRFEVTTTTRTCLPQNVLKPLVDQTVELVPITEDPPAGISLLAARGDAR